MRPFHLISIILILGFICCSCSEVIKGEKGNNYVTAKLINKYHADFHNTGTYSTTYEFEFTNLSDEDISHYEGVVKVLDIVGKEIASLNIKDTSGIKAKSSTTYTSTIESDQDIIKIKVQGIDNLDIKWVANKVVLRK